MSAVVIDLAPLLASRKARAARRIAAPYTGSAASAHDFTFWRGATGTRYVHTIYSLIQCPELPAANVLLVHRHESGRTEVLHVTSVEHAAQSLNLAEIRYTAARLGANEVHVHLLAATAAEREAIARDLAGAGEMSAVGSAVRLH